MQYNPSKHSVADSRTSLVATCSVAGWVVALFLVWFTYLLLRSQETVADTIMPSVLVPLLAQGYGIDLSRAKLGIDLIKDQSLYYWVLPGYGLVGLYPLGMCLLAAPLQLAFWAVAYVSGFDVSVAGPEFGAIRFAIEKLSAAFLAAVAVVYVYRAVRLFTSKSWALFIGLVYAFGSGSVSLLAQGLWQQTGINLMCVMMVHFLLAHRGSPSFKQEVVFYLAAGVLFAIRPTALLWSVGLCCSFAAIFRRPSLIAITSLIIGMAPALIWNVALYSHPLGGYAVGVVSNFDWGIIDWAERFWLTLFSSRKGFLFFHPLLVFLLFAPLALRHLDRSRKVVVGMLLALELAHILFCSTNPNWHGGRGFGPRYTLDGLGVAFILSGLGVAFSSARWPRATAVVALLAGLFSLVLHIFGAIGARLSDAGLVALHQQMMLPK